MRHSQADVERARADLGYRPTADVPRGLHLCLDWWRQRERARALQPEAA